MTHTEETLAALSGTDFAGYRVGAKIGSGGYAWVFRATDPDLGRDVALKILMPTSRGSGYPAKLRERFYREARLVARLRDPRSIKIIEHGEEKGLLFIAFEFVDGRALDSWLRDGQPLRALRVAKILEQILESLADAHELGIVHRDIKPGNVMLYELAGRRDQVKLLDFGIGKFTDKQMNRDLTREGGVVGTPRYMAPEQLLGGDASPASDIYSVGLVAYELLTAQRAIKSGDPVEAIAEVISSEDLRLPDTVDAPQGLIDVVHKMLARDVERRYSSAIEVLDDLQTLRTTTESEAALAARGQPALEPSELTPTADLVEQADASPDTRARTLVLSCVALALGAFIVWATLEIVGEPSADALPGAELVEVEEASAKASLQEEPASEPEPSEDSLQEEPVVNEAEPASLAEQHPEAPENPEAPRAEQKPESEREATTRAPGPTSKETQRAADTAPPAIQRRRSPVERSPETSPASAPARRAKAAPEVEPEPVAAPEPEIEAQNTEDSESENAAAKPEDSAERGPQLWSVD